MNKRVVVASLVEELRTLNLVDCLVCEEGQ